MTFESLSHSRFDCKYHLVFVPKYRKKKLYGEIRRYLGPVFHELAQQKGCTILKGNISMLFDYAPAFTQQVQSSQRETTCLTDPIIQNARSKELATLFDADQKDRENGAALSQKEWDNVNARDRVRRMRVGEIYGEGCFKTAADYHAASMIYQHRDVSAHYYQAFIWANRAVELGDVKSKTMVALTLDRYLVSIGKKQLFGSQFFASDTSGWCYCLQPVERSFPDSLRKNYLGRTLDQEYAELTSLNQGKDNCSQRESQEPLEPSRQGTVPGFW